MSQNRGPENKSVSQNRGPEKKLGFKYWDRKRNSISNMGPEKNLVLKYGTGRIFKFLTEGLEKLQYQLIFMFQII